MRRRPARAALLFVLSVLLAAVPAAAGPAATGLTRPDMAAFTVARNGDAAVAVLERDQGRVRLGAIGSDGRVGPWEELGPFARPVLIASDETGLLVVVDGAEGQWKVEKLRRGAREGNAGRLQLPKPQGEPVGAAARNGILWVVFRKPSSILFFALDGAYLGRAGAEGDLASPYSVALTDAGDAFVTDPMGPRVAAYNATGQLTALHDLTGSGFTRPTGVAVDGAGTAWLSDGVTGAVACLAPGEGRSRLGCLSDKRFDDPLRLLFGPAPREGLWVLEGRAGRLAPVEAKAP